jgi:hypothetical protein
MAFKMNGDRETPVLIAEIPLSPINNDGAYKVAIALLDRLYDLGDRRTPAETEYFHALVLLACEYENSGVGIQKRRA